ncbi:hypothetical protein ACIQAA_27985 [Neobacillus sp. NPDC093182]
MPKKSIDLLLDKTACKDEREGAAAYLSSSIIAKLKMHFLVLQMI